MMTCTVEKKTSEEVIEDLKDFCRKECELYAEYQQDHHRSPVDRMISSGQRMAYYSVLRYLEELEEAE